MGYDMKPSDLLSMAQNAQTKRELYEILHYLFMNANYGSKFQNACSTLSSVGELYELVDFRAIISNFIKENTFQIAKICLRNPKLGENLMQDKEKKTETYYDSGYKQGVEYGKQLEKIRGFVHGVKETYKGTVNFPTENGDRKQIIPLMVNNDNVIPLMVNEHFVIPLTIDNTNVIPLLVDNDYEFPQQVDKTDNTDTWDMRVANELAELNKKINQLVKFLKSDKVNTISEYQKDLLTKQLSVMREYGNILYTRLVDYNSNQNRSRKMDSWIGVGVTFSKNNAQNKMCNELCEPKTFCK